MGLPNRSLVKEALVIAPLLLYPLKSVALPFMGMQTTSPEFKFCAALLSEIKVSRTKTRVFISEFKRFFLIKDRKKLVHGQ